MNTKEKCYRHGEILLKKVSELPKGLELSKSNIIMQGSHGNNHSIDTGKLYFKKEGDYIFGYLVAKNTNLLHAEHGVGKGSLKKAKIDDGIYQLLKQNEYTPSGLIPVRD